MPIYEYKCKDEACAEITEKMRSVKDRDDPLPCPKCNSDTKKIVSKGSFQLEGGGWASDGYS